MQPTHISKGHTSSSSGEAIFTGFPCGKDFLRGNPMLFKQDLSEALEGFTYEVKSTGENITAGAGTYTVMGTGKFTGELSGTFDNGEADFSKVDFTTNPTEAVYTGTAKKALSVNKKTGKVSVKRGAKSGTYRLMVKATAAKTDSIETISKNVIVTVRVTGKVGKKSAKALMVQSAIPRQAAA